MNTSTLPDTVREDPSPTTGLPREVIATIVQWRGRIALFKRSQSVGHERGLWHCISGYLEPKVSPEQQALTELEEEAGLTLQDLADFQRGEQLLIPDHEGNPWLVHTFTATSLRRRLTINDEHDAYRWTIPSKISRFSNRVPWLDTVLQAAPRPSTGEQQ
ncbi:NUDIX domain-containing protein [Arthrobacter sp. MMS24-T111]